jgi:hypothetical protein
MIKMNSYINELLKFWGLLNFETSSHCLNGFKDGPGLTTSRGREKSGESEENRERDVDYRERKRNLCNYQLNRMQLCNTAAAAAACAD